MSILLLDGGTGRELRRIGAPFKQPEWSALALLEGPEYVFRVHQAYVAAGANIITTNSYAIVPFHLGEERFAARGSELATLAGHLARSVADTAARKVQVAGSLPPICGSYRADWFDPVFARPILATLVTALRPHVDFWLAETLSSIGEARLVRDVLGSDNLPLWIAFTLQDNDSAPAQPSPAPPCPAQPAALPRLRSGELVSDAVAVALELGAQAVLFNCSQPEVMAAGLAAAQTIVSQRAGEHGNVRLGVYANAFPPQAAEAQANSSLLDIRVDLDPSSYLAFARGWVARGATIVGGCCGVGPEHIAALQALQSL